MKDSTSEQDASTEDASPEERPARLFDVDGTTYADVKTLERRGNGEVLILAERHLPQGQRGLVTLKRLRGPVTFPRKQRLLEEVQLAFRLQHPAIAQVHHLTVHRGVPYVIMEHVDGPSLQTVISLAAMRGQPVPEPFALHVAAEVADALHHAHTLEDDAGRPLRLLHRDVSPRNVRLCQRTGAVKLTDFGAAYSRMVGREETPGLLLKGDVAYASPEYLHGRPMDARSDLFSLGLLLVELLTGRHLFDVDGLPDGPPPPEARVPTDEEPSLPLQQMMAWVDRYGPPEVERAVAGCARATRALLHQVLRRAPAERPATAAALRDALRAALPGPYGRPEVAAELARLLSDATVLRDKVELTEDFPPPGLDPHERTPPSGEGRP
jgi:serine/threonine-protein kinase